MKWHAIIGHRSLEFASLLAETRFYELQGQPVTIELDDRPTAEMRRFFEGAVVPYVFYQSATAWKDFRECREALKLEFLPGWTRDMHGLQVKIPRSTLDLNKESFRHFLARIEVWTMENGYEWPDHEAYKEWRDSGPLKGEVYPPIARMKDLHAAKHAAAAPWSTAKFKKV